MAREICDAIGVRFDEYSIDRESVEMSLRDAGRIAGLCNGMANSILLHLTEDACRKYCLGCDVLLSGVGGETFRGCLILKGQPEPRTPEEVASRFAGVFRVNREPELVRGMEGETGYETIEDFFWLRSRPPISSTP